MKKNYLSIFPEQPLERIALDQWQIQYASREEGLERGFHTALMRESDAAEASGKAADWQSQPVPGLLRATAGRDTVWYCCSFDYHNPVQTMQALLRFEGCFLEAEVWLNGKNLGGHYGYFAPWSLDATPHLREGENMLVVCVQSPVETGNLQHKRHIMGVFNDWDCKPYPNNASFNLPPEYEWFVPLGFWAPVTLDLCGPVVIEAVYLTPQFPDTGWHVVDGRLRDATAQVLLRLRMRNITDDVQRLRVGVDIVPHNFSDDWSFADEESLVLSPGEASDISALIDIPQAALWYPWTQGAPNLYRCTLTLKWGGRVISLPALQLIRTFGMREVQARITPPDGEGKQAGWEWWLNGRRIFPKGSNYVADFMLDQATPEVFRRDLELAREANMDMLRLHAHIAPQAFYQIADEGGMLVFCDFPMIFTYAYKQSEEVQAFVREAMLAQLPEMIDLLQIHPSIVLWCVHNEPPWPDLLAWFGEAHIDRHHRELDEEGKRVLEALDPSRPVLSASGHLDEHIYNGWYWSTLAEVRALVPPFPSEFGAQALPNLTSPFWENVNTQWPVDNEEPSWRYACYQSIQWAQFGIGEPHDYATLEEYITESQEYQAALCAYIINQFRLKKFQPCGGMLHFMLTDCFPGITWSVLDYYRQPKLAYEAIKQAYEPTHIILDWDGDWAFQQHHRLAFKPGGAFLMRMYVVNDSPYTLGEAELRWSLRQVGGGGSPFGVLLRPVSRTKSGVQRFSLPKSNEPALLVAEVKNRIGPGDYLLEATLRQGDRIIDHTKVEFRAGTYPARRRRNPQLHTHGKPLNVPAFIVNKIYHRGSLRNDTQANGFYFTLENTLQNAVLTGVLHLDVDGRTIPLNQVQLEYDNERTSVALINPEAPVDLPVGRRITVRIERMLLEPGQHTLTVILRVPGFGDARVQTKDMLMVEALAE